ncbi:hypothetical protein [Bradyrhizobium sp. 142]|uniref:hypothetical protein n=1 Tax=Bradyrhizobium sp. 142 TaxID=2782618 RepID=UPI001FFC1628|nr:hypothetical protein [Bradyrhizobium sp. 142]MCK1727583.1 hypothetical protein [Bradyrhizobium sp. 142]
MTPNINFLFSRMLDRNRYRAHYLLIKRTIRDYSVPDDFAGTAPSGMGQNSHGVPVLLGLASSATIPGKLLFAPRSAPSASGQGSIEHGPFARSRQSRSPKEWELSVTEMLAKIIDLGAYSAQKRTSSELFRGNESLMATCSSLSSLYLFCAFLAWCQFALLGSPTSEDERA